MEWPLSVREYQHSLKWECIACQCSFFLKADMSPGLKGGGTGAAELLKAIEGGSPLVWLVFQAAVSLLCMHFYSAWPTAFLLGLLFKSEAESALRVDVCHLFPLNSNLLEWFSRNFHTDWVAANLRFIGVKQIAKVGKWRWNLHSGPDQCLSTTKQL